MVGVERKFRGVFKTSLPVINLYFLKWKKIPKYWKSHADLGSWIEIYIVLVSNPTKVRIWYEVSGPISITIKIYIVPISNPIKFQIWNNVSDPVSITIKAKFGFQTRFFGSNPLKN